MTNYKKYKHKETGEIVEADFHLDDIGGCWILKRDKDPFVSPKEFNQQYEEIQMTKPKLKEWRNAILIGIIVISPWLILSWAFYQSNLK